MSSSAGLWAAAPGSPAVLEGQECVYGWFEQESVSDHSQKMLLKYYTLVFLKNTWVIVSFPLVNDFYISLCCLNVLHGIVLIP